MSTQHFMTMQSTTQSCSTNASITNTQTDPVRSQTIMSIKCFAYKFITELTNSIKRRKTNAYVLRRKLVCNTMTIKYIKQNQ